MQQAHDALAECHRLLDDQSRRLQLEHGLLLSKGPSLKVSSHNRRLERALRCDSSDPEDVDGAAMGATAPVGDKVVVLHDGRACSILCPEAGLSAEGAEENVDLDAVHDLALGLVNAIELRRPGVQPAIFLHRQYFE
jgi:hypothetical protein